LIFRPQYDEVLPVMLETGKLDMAVCMIESSPNAAIKSIRLRSERIFLLAHPSHPLAGRKTVKPADLAGQTLLLTESGCGYRLKLDQQMALQNVRPGNVTEFSSVEAIKQCVIAGMGLGLLPAIVVARELRQLQIKALHWAGPSMDIETYILWHKDKWISPAMAAFMDLVREKLEDSEGESPHRTQGDFAAD
jgi:DNA-binding transcriptional LysR family regulator